MQVELSLDGHCCGPLFAPPCKHRVVRKVSGGRRVWGQYQRTRPSAHDNAVFRDLQTLGRIYGQVLGVRFSVDHTVPLQHPLVCGLHRVANFQVLPLLDNVRKGNNWWPDMPAVQGELL
jgi:hypothetical protein